MNEWHKSSFCSTDQATEQCPEVKRLDEDCVAVRSSIFPDKIVNFTQDEWETLVKGMKAGDYDTV